MFSAFDLVLLGGGLLVVALIGLGYLMAVRRLERADGNRGAPLPPLPAPRATIGHAADKVRI